MMPWPFLLFQGECRNWNVEHDQRAGQAGEKRTKEISEERLQNFLGRRRAGVWGYVVRPAEETETRRGVQSDTSSNGD